MGPTSILRRLLANPYLYSATILARIAVLFATAMWSFLVLFDPGRLDPVRYPIYTEMLALFPASVWAAGGALICSLAFWRIWCHCPPHWSGPILYASLMGFWLYIATSLLMQTHIPPAAGSCIVTVALLAIFAFISNPKNGDVPTL